MFFPVSLIDDIHGMVDLRGEEDRVLYHGRNSACSKAINCFLRTMGAKTQVIRRDPYNWSW